MPWGTEDAKRFTKKATTRRRSRLWMETANRSLKSGDSEGEAVKKANAAVKAATGKGL